MTMAAIDWDRLADALEYPEGEHSSVQEQYVDAFDLDPACTLDMGWHLFGDSPERARFLSIMREAACRAGLTDRGELPDHLATLLRIMGREDPAMAAELAVLIAPAVAGVRDRLKARGNAFAAILEPIVRAIESARCEAQP